MRVSKTKLMAAAASVAILALHPAQAANDAWLTTPVDNNYNNAANYVGGTVPGTGETATFGDVRADGTNFSDPYFVQFGQDTIVGAFSIFGPNTKYVYLINDTIDVTFNGAGVGVNNPSKMPAFNIANGGTLTFTGVSASASNVAVAGGRVSYSIAGTVNLNSGASAGNADLQIGVTGAVNVNDTSTLGAALVLNNNTLAFNDSGSAGSAAITNNDTIDFNDTSRAASAAILNNGTMNFSDSSTADASVITMGPGATVTFSDTSSGGTARIVLNGAGNEFVDMQGFTGPEFEIGSIEGGNSGDIVRIGYNNVTKIGGNNFSATDGVVTLNASIQGGETGEFHKVGSGELILGNNANTFFADVVLANGKLTIGADGALGSATNSVTFTGGTLRATETFTSTRNFTLDGQGTFEVDTAKAFTVANPIVDGGETGVLIKRGDGDLILIGTNTYTGGTQIKGGRLLMGDGGTVGEISGNVATDFDTSFVINRSDDLTFAGNISGAGAFTQAGAGNTTLTGTNTYSGYTFIFNGILTASGGAAIGDNSAVAMLGGTFVLATDETVGALTGDSPVDLGANTLTLNWASGTSTYNGIISGTGNLVKNGGYTQILGSVDTPGAQLYTGTTTVNAGNLIVNGSLAGDLIVNAGGTFGGNATINGSFTNSGALTPGNSPGATIVVGDYIGAGNPTYTVDILAQSQNAPVNGVTHDFMNIGDDYVGVSTQLLLNPTGTAVATTGNGIEIARVADVSADGNFFLSAGAQTAQNGFYQGFQYVVNRTVGSGPGGADQFFLQTQVREEIVANAAALAASRQLARDCFRGTVAPAAGGSGKGGHGWLNVRAGSFNSDAANGVDYDSNYNCVSGGFDAPAGDGVTLGLRGGFANGDLDLRTAQGEAQMDSMTWNLEAAVTFVTGEFYAGLSAGWTAHDWDYDHALASGNSSSETIDGATGALVAGYRGSLGGASALTFEGMVSYDGSECGSNCFLAGTVEDISEWEGRLLGRYDTKIDGVMPYLQVSLTSDFDNGHQVAFGNAVASADLASMLLGVNAGLAANLGGNWTGSVDLGTTQGLDSEVDGYHGAVGLKTSW